MKFQNIVGNYDQQPNKWRANRKTYEKYTEGLQELFTEFFKALSTPPIDLSDNVRLMSLKNKIIAGMYHEVQNTCGAEFTKLGDIGQLDIDKNREDIQQQLIGIHASILQQLLSSFNRNITVSTLTLAEQKQLETILQAEFNKIIWEELADLFNQATYKVANAEGMNLLQLAVIHNHDRVVRWLVERHWPDESFSAQEKPSELARSSLETSDVILEILKQNFSESNRQFRERGAYGLIQIMQGKLKDGNVGITPYNSELFPSPDITSGIGKDKKNPCLFLQLLTKEHDVKLLVEQLLLLDGVSVLNEKSS